MFQNKQQMTDNAMDRRSTDELKMLGSKSDIKDTMRLITSLLYNYKLKHDLKLCTGLSY